MLAAAIPYFGKLAVKELVKHPTFYKGIYDYFSGRDNLNTTYHTPPYLVHSDLADYQLKEMSSKRNGNGNGKKNGSNGRSSRRNRRRNRNRNIGSSNANAMGASNLNQVVRSAPVALGSIIGARNLGRLRRMPIRHSELFASIEGTAAFTAGGTPFNPGLAVSFPWLSRIALVFEKYLVNNVTYHYVPSLPSDTPGNIYLGFEYDPTELLPSSKMQFMMNQDSTSASAWMPVSLQLDPSKCRQRGELYVRTSGLTGSQDIKTYDLGIFEFATSGISGITDTIGDLYIEYSIDLLIPTSWENELIAEMWYDDTLSSPTASAPFGVSNVTGVVTGSSVVAILSYDSVLTRNVLTWYVPGYYFLAITISAADIDSLTIGLDLTTVTGTATNKNFGTVEPATNVTTITLCAGIFVSDYLTQTRMSISGTGVAITTISSAQLIIMPISADIYNSALF